MLVEISKVGWRRNTKIGKITKISIFDKAESDYIRVYLEALFNGQTYDMMGVFSYRGFDRSSSKFRYDSDLYAISKELEEETYSFVELTTWTNNYISYYINLL